jgi:Amt family ammonium transporter
MLGVSLMFTTTAAADDDVKAETSVTTGEGSPKTPAADEADGKKEAEVPLTPVEALKKETTYTINTLIMFICAVLVLFMQAGFAMLEVGLNSAKNTVNILFKNVMDLSVGVILFLLIGYGLMYGGNPEENKYFGYSHPLMELNDGEAEIKALPDYSASADFLFQVAFAATAATIVSGAVAGRMKFGAYLIYSAILTGLIYPISGYWKWGGGFLDMMGFQDFAGSVVVHAVGGFAGLAGAIVLGARLGRFTRDGKSVPMPGHNIAFAALGVFILWVGWYGFNPGSQLAYFGGANATATTNIALTTTIAAACGALVAMIVAWVLFKKPDVTMALNGALAGLVGITANCDRVTQEGAMAIGAVAGILVVAGILLLDKLRIDDPVGAWPVHGLCGVWGGIATGIFGAIPVDDAGQAIFASRGAFIWTQCLSTAIICVWAFGTMFALFYALKAIGILRVSPEDEQVGLDVSEHGMHAYPPGLVADYHPAAPAATPAGKA